MHRTEFAESLLDHEMVILSRAISPESGDWAPAVARAVLSIGLTSSDRDRMNELAAGAREGSLTPDEELEIESYRQACRLMECLKARAHASLRQARTALT